MFINRKVGACTSDKGRPQTKHQTQEQWRVGGLWKGRGPREGEG